MRGEMRQKKRGEVGEPRGVGWGVEERGSKEVISKGEGAREGRNEESDYFIIKPSLTWAAATARTLLRPSLCGSACAFVCIHTRCRLCVCFSMRGNFFFFSFLFLLLLLPTFVRNACVFMFMREAWRRWMVHIHVMVAGLKVCPHWKESSFQESLNVVDYFNF